MEQRVFPASFQGEAPGLSALRAKGLPEKVVTMDNGILTIFFDFRLLPGEKLPRTVPSLDEQTLKVGEMCFWMSRVSKEPHARHSIMTGLETGTVWMEGDDGDGDWPIFMNSSTQQFEACLCAIRNWRIENPVFEEQTKALPAVIALIASIEPSVAENHEPHYWRDHLSGLVIDHDMSEIKLPWC